jgi:hypothetical protein
MTLFVRSRSILTHPVQEWEVIAQEQTNLARLFFGYVMPLAAIGPIASLIEMTLIGVRVSFAGADRVPLTSGLEYCVVSYALTVLGTFALALIINALAPMFDGRKDAAQALKVSAYAGTAAWIASIFALIPALAFLSALGLYSFYLLYAGLPTLMQSPKERALGYAATVAGCAIVLFIFFGYAAQLLTSYPTTAQAATGVLRFQQ